MNWVKAIEEIGTKIGACAAIFAAYLFFEIQDMKAEIVRLDQTTSDLAEVKENVSAINAKLQILLDDFSSKRYMLKNAHAD